MDAQAGIHYEGEEPPQATHEDRLAVKAWNFLSSGTGGIDWAGVPVVAAVLGIDDVEALMDRLLVIKTHRPPEVDQHG